jgi:hypothetical protein
LKKQSQFAKGRNERNVFSDNGLWRFCRFETAEEQSQFRAKHRPLAGSPKRQMRSPKQGHFTECDLKKQSQFAGAPD